MPLFAARYRQAGLRGCDLRDGPNVYHREERLEIPGTAVEPLPLRIALLDPRQRKFRHRVTIVTTDGRLIQNAPIDGEETIIGAGRACEGSSAGCGGLRRTLPPASRPRSHASSQSAWPEMVDRWSRLTPTGFPVELSSRRATRACAGPSRSPGRKWTMHADLASSQRGLPRQGSQCRLPCWRRFQAVQRGRDLLVWGLAGRPRDQRPSSRVSSSTVKYLLARHATKSRFRLR